MISVGFQLILSILIASFCLFFSLILYNIVKIQSNPNKIIGTIIPVIDEGIRIYYKRLCKLSFIIIIIFFIALTFIPRYNIKFATSLLLGGICALLFSVYVNKTLKFLYLNILNKHKKKVYQFFIFITIAVVGLFSLSLPIIICAILFFLFEDEENIQYVTGFLVGMGGIFIMIRVSGIIFKENIFCINKKIENYLTSMQIDRYKYYNLAVSVMNKTINNILSLCSELFENYIFIMVAAILIASMISPSEMELLSNVSLDIRSPLMFLPVALSTVILIVFIVNAFMLFLFRTVKVDIIVKYLLYVIFFTLVSLSFIIIFLYGLNIRVFLTFFIGSLIALLYNIIYSNLETRHIRYNVINIFIDIFALSSLLSIAIMLSMYISGIYGLSIMFFGFVSFNGIFISEIIIYYMTWYINKVGITLVTAKEKTVQNIDNIFNYYEKNPYDIFPYVIAQAVNTSLILLVIFIVRHNISLMNIAAFYTIGGFLLGGSILSLEFILIYFTMKKNILIKYPTDIHSLRISTNMGVNNIIDNFFLNMIDRCAKNTIIKLIAPFLSLTVILLVLFVIFGHNIIAPFIIGSLCTYLAITLIFISLERILKDRATDGELSDFKNFCSIFGCDIIKFVALITLMFRFGI